MELLDRAEIEQLIREFFAVSNAERLPQLDIIADCESTFVVHLFRRCRTQRG